MSQQAAHATGLTRGQGRDQEREHRPLSMTLIRRLWRYTTPYAGKRNALMVLVVARAIQLPALLGVAKAVISGPIERGDFHGTVLGVLGFAALAVSTELVFHFRVRYALELGEDVIHDLRRDIFGHIQKLTMGNFDRTKMGRLISRMTSDAEAVRLGVQDVIFVSLVQIGQGIVAAGFMIYYDWQLFLVVATVAPVLFVVINYFRKKLSRAYRDVQESFSQLTAAVVESVGGMRETQGFARQETNAALFDDQLTSHAGYNMHVARTAGLFLPMLELTSQTFMAVILGVGGYRILTGTQADPGTLIGFFFMVPLFFQPCSVIGRMYNQALRAMAGAERVFRLLDTERDWRDPTEAKQLPTIEGHVVFDGVTFGYDPERPVLHDISFEARPGQTLAFVGETGSGKSSIINLIAKFYLPDAGEIRIDGHRITEVATPSLRRQLGIVLQENFLFEGTVMDNIRIGAPEASDGDVRSAARELDCLDLLEQLPDGLYTRVGESGGSISLGQRQLICFARAMLADPRILLLDEATSAVDPMTEARIQSALEILLAGRTSFIVAHRLSTVRHTDAVLVLDKGRIVERGPHDALIARGQVYARLYRQFLRGGES